ncbi:hypothetical protein LWI28_018300 [Acer negundo]|uniref:Uncharacterized protein n=1 Tax=Acer negundo TaxID=4023 RepID=A0AAD5NSN6_ACENE|nr:hypothetical protein LWI28_018300 [Acer negundo]
MTDSGTAIVKEKLVEVMKLLEEDVDIINVLESNLEKGKRKASDHSNHDNLVYENSVLNPPIANFGWFLRLFQQGIDEWWIWKSWSV